MELTLKRLCLSILFILLPLTCFAAVVKGTNAGFVTVAPSADPTGIAVTLDGYAIGNKDTSDATAATVTQMGWYASRVDNAANYELGIYSHDAGGDLPNVLLNSDTVNTVSAVGWQNDTMSWSITGSTTYWLAWQSDAVAGANQSDRSGTVAGYRYSYDGAAVTALQNPWVSDGAVGRMYACYAVWQVAAGTDTTFYNSTLYNATIY